MTVLLLDTEELLVQVNGVEGLRAGSCVGCCPAAARSARLADKADLRRGDIGSDSDSDLGFLSFFYSNWTKVSK